MPLPPPNDIPLAASDIEKLQWALDTVRRHEGWIRSLRVTGAAFQNNVFGASISIPPPIKPRAGRGEPDETCIIRLSSAASGDEKYIARRQVGEVTTVEAGGLVMPEGLTDADDFVLAINLAGDGQTGHSVPIPSYHIARLTNRFADDMRVVEFSAVTGIAPICVRVHNDGGSGGTVGTPATWTYAIYLETDIGLVNAISSGVIVTSRMFPIPLTAAADGTLALAVWNHDTATYQIMAGTIAETVAEVRECPEP